MIVRVCYRCGLILGTIPDPRVLRSHGLCPKCAAEEMERWTGALVVVTDHKVRVRRPSRPGTDPA